MIIMIRIFIMVSSVQLMSVICFALRVGLATLYVPFLDRYSNILGHTCLSVRTMYVLKVLSQGCTGVSTTTRIVLLHQMLYQLRAHRMHNVADTLYNM